MKTKLTIVAGRRSFLGFATGMLVAVFFAGTLLGAVPAAPESARKTQAAIPEDKNYRVDEPGTITFTVGMVIKGKVDKPQVIIFLPKEKHYFRSNEYHHSYRDEPDELLPFIPILESESNPK